MFSIPDESILDDMLAKMQDEKFMSNFPLLQLALKKGQNKASGEEDSNEPDPKEVLIKIIRGCKFVGYDVLLGMSVKYVLTDVTLILWFPILILFTSEAMSGPSGVENVKVDEDSVSGFGGELGSEEYQEGGEGGDDYYYGYEEDYDEDFEDEQEELEGNHLREIS